MIGFTFALLLTILHSTPSGASNGLRGENSLSGPQPRIIGGEDVDEPRYPYFAMMWGRSLCGGALIAPDLVVSAAHCSEAANDIIIGRYKRNGSWEDDGSETIDIETKVLYPSSQSRSMDNDIMIMKLKDKSTKPYIKLNPNSTDDGQELTVIGFGDTLKGYGLVIPTELQEVQLNYLTNEECQDMHRRYTISDDMMCALGKEKDSCNGDSGGPLIIKGDSIEEDELVGTVSWGIGCADERYPGVYSRISYFYDWIVERACELSEDPPDYFNCNEVDAYTVFSATDVLGNQIEAPPTSSPTTNNVLDFLAWSPSLLPLQHCEGDCDKDMDCAGEMICYQRDRGHIGGVPGCEDDNDAPPALADFCIFPSDDPT